MRKFMEKFGYLTGFIFGRVGVARYTTIIFWFLVALAILLITLGH